MNLDDYDISRTYRARVLKNERITPAESADEIRELVLEVQQHAFSFSAGQSVGVLMEGPHELGHEHQLRLYTVADTPAPSPDGHPEVTIVVKRCNYIDDYSGESYQGVTSNYLCDLREGDSLTLTGPYGLAFDVPEDRGANLILIGLGTGIAPFRAFLKHIYQDLGGWSGKVRLLFGAQSGLELLYMNDHRNDLARYYDEATFEAIHALSPRPEWADPIAWDFAIEERADEILSLLEDPDTYVYIAGLKEISATLDAVFAKVVGDRDAWERRKAELQAAGRWAELTY